MAHRTKQGQKVHDQKVAELARGLRQRGYQVQSDLPGHPKPPTLNNQVPDIVARKGSKVLVREVETKSTLQTDKRQQQALQRWADQHGAEFRVILAKKKR